LKRRGLQSIEALALAEAQAERSSFSLLQAALQIHSIILTIKAKHR
jgi:hypothetical protein